MKIPDVYEYDDAISFFKSIYAFEACRDSHVTLAKFAKFFGFATHGSIQHCLAGRRVLPKRLVEGIISRYKYDSGRQFYFKSLVELDKKPALRNNQDFMMQMIRSRPIKYVSRYKQMEDPEFFKNGLMLMCFVMGHLKDFSIETAIQQLEGQFTRKDVLSAFEKLHYLGLFKNEKPTTDVLLYNENEQENKLDVQRLHEWFKYYMAQNHANPRRVIDDCWWSGMFMTIDESLMEDIKKFITYKVSEFHAKFAADSGTSSNLSYVMFSIQRINNKVD